MKAMSTAVSAVRHAFGALLEASVLVAIVGVLAFGVALATGQPAGADSVFAAKGGNGGGAKGGGAATASVTISVPDGVFDGTTTATVTGASGLWVEAACSAASGGGLVEFVQTDGSGVAVLPLGPTPTWMSGAAACTAQAGSWDSQSRWQAVASTTFNVSG